ncbi:hypothetical protein E9529_15780 [Blastococcus sp. KM273128]|uniref:hypothetical protein n=1 Tax=Blastococcus sp. KM273128 TaxID=2570314 RepID=UPI001F2DACC5|nr:hypothetical protein [Blastococcus sp. KM273128]MCF6745706.1 hypothetical protein [Blastococcus sp. KM273128]
MTAPAGEIDWDTAERRERRHELLGLPGIACFFVGMVLLTGGIGPLTGGAAWAVVGGMLAFIVLMTASSQLIPRLRANTSGGYRIQIALNRHIDPGPEWRARTDRQARYTAGVAWFGWAALIAPLAFLLNGQWDRPMAAAAGTVLLVGAASAWMLWWRRRVLAARRWLADPPGPAREALPPTTAERWLTGRRGLATIVVSALALGLIIGLVAAFAEGS